MEFSFKLFEELTVSFRTPQPFHILEEEKVRLLFTNEVNVSRGKFPVLAVPSTVLASDRKVGARRSANEAYEFPRSFRTLNHFSQALMLGFVINELGNGVPGVAKLWFLNAQYSPGVFVGFEEWLVELIDEHNGIAGELESEVEKSCTGEKSENLRFRLHCRIPIVWTAVRHVKR